MKFLRNGKCFVRINVISYAGEHRELRVWHQSLRCGVFSALGCAGPVMPLLAPARTPRGSGPSALKDLILSIF